MIEASETYSYTTYVGVFVNGETVALLMTLCSRLDTTVGWVWGWVSRVNIAIITLHATRRGGWQVLRSDGIRSEKGGGCCCWGLSDGRGACPQRAEGAVLDERTAVLYELKPPERSLYFCEVIRTLAASLYRYILSVQASRRQHKTLLAGSFLCFLTLLALHSETCMGARGHKKTGHTRRRKETM